MNREPDDPIDDVGTWSQPPTGKGMDSALPVGEPTVHGTSYTPNETPLPSGEKSFTPSETPFPSDDKSSTPSETPDPSGEKSITPSETPDPSDDITDKDSRNPSNGKQERTRAGHGSSEWDMTPPPLVAEGEILFGKYRLDKKIGEGGMGSVWKVWHLDMESERALKLIHPEIAQKDKGWRRFKREAQLMDKIKHPGAVRVYDYKRTQGLAYIEMEFVPGRSLDEILKSNGGKPMPLDWIAQVVEQLCAVLQEAHGHVDEKTGKPKPIIHRDLKPSNLMLIESKHQGQAFKLKVLDFGIAKMIEDEGGSEQTVTAAGDILGTPAYMSPEQITTTSPEKIKGGSDLDGRSDLYSTGVVLYHLLTGVRPFRGNAMAMIGAHLNLVPPPMKESNPAANVPPEVERVVMQCLEKDPANRPQSANELAEKFLRAVGERPGQRNKLATRLMAAAAAILLAGLVLFTVPLIPQFWNIIPTKIIIEPPPPPPPKPPPEPWIPNGYEAATKDRAKDAPDEWMKLKRTEGGVVYVRSDKPGVYIPEGYNAEFSDPTNPKVVTRLVRSPGGAKFDRFSKGVFLPFGYKEVPGDQGGSWPSALVRSKDNVKFIRIEGGKYQRGDPGDVPAKDSERELCTPHYVRVPSFYIQETEVTNGEIEDYVNEEEEKEREKALRNWKLLYSTQCGDNGKEEIKFARRFPAANIDYWAARKYAESVQGLLPTEAEWEYAARSRGQDNAYSYGKATSANELKANLESANRNFAKKKTGIPQSVDEFPDDATDQHVLGMTGNVQELCVDVYKPYGQLDLTKYTSIDPLVDCRDDALPKEDDLVVVKGGSFNRKQSEAKSFLRYTLRANDRTASIGFRVVIECPPEEKDWPPRR